MGSGVGRDVGTADGRTVGLAVGFVGEGVGIIDGAVGDVEGRGVVGRAVLGAAVGTLVPAARWKNMSNATATTWAHLAR